MRFNSGLLGTTMSSSPDSSDISAPYSIEIVAQIEQALQDSPDRQKNITFATVTLEDATGIVLGQGAGTATSSPVRVQYLPFKKPYTR